MIGLILLFAIGKYFYKLAQEFEKSPPFGYAILGIVVYYGGMFLFLITLGITLNIIAPDSMFIEDGNDLVLGIMAMPCGVLCCWLLSKYLRKRWTKTPVSSALRHDVLDQGLDN